MVEHETVQDLSDDEMETAEPSALDGLEHHGKHASLWVLTEWFHQTLVGRKAQALLDADDLPDVAGMWVPSTFGWMHPKVNVGRKNRGAGDRRLLMPVYLEWQREIVLMPPGAEECVGWVTRSMGHHAAGEAVVSTSPSLFEQVEERTCESEIPVRARVPELGRHELMSRLGEMAEEGRAAYWSMLTRYEGTVRYGIVRAHAAIAADVASFLGVSNRPLLDEESIGELVTAFVLGGDEEESPLVRILELAMEPEKMSKVDPVRYIQKAINRDTAEAVRRRVGDPRVGHKVRSVVRDRGLDPRDLGAVVSALRDLYPRDRISSDRAAAAMSVLPDAMASACDFGDR